ncbi:MAG: hypothetical protein ACLQBD_01115 [Syntrophobacteraceae bacterium]
MANAVIELDSVKTSLGQVAQTAINNWDPATLTACANIMTAINSTQAEINAEEAQVVALPDIAAGSAGSAPTGTTGASS